MKKIIKYFLIVISSLVVIVITALILIWTISNDERKIAKDFTLLSSSGKYNEATELMHNALKKEFTLESFEKAFKNAKPYIETSFQSVNIENSVTTLEGTAKITSTYILNNGEEVPVATVGPEHLVSKTKN